MFASLHELGRHAHQLPQTSTVAATSHAAHLTLHKQLHDHHTSAVDSILLISTLSTTRLVKEVRGLAHRHTEKLGLGIPTSATGGGATAGSEHLEGLHGRCSTDGTGVHRASVAAFVCFLVSVCDVLFVQGLLPLTLKRD
jgi:hypothetical protein